MHSNNYPVQQTAHNNARPPPHKSSPRVSEGFNGFLLLPHTPYLHSGGGTDLASDHARYHTVFQNTETIITPYGTQSPKEWGGNMNISKPREEILPRPSFTTTAFTTTTTPAPGMAGHTLCCGIEDSSADSVLLNQTLDTLNTDTSQESAGDPIEQGQEKYEPGMAVSPLQPELIHVNIWNNIARNL